MAQNLIEPPGVATTANASHQPVRRAGGKRAPDVSEQARDLYAVLEEVYDGYRTSRLNVLYYGRRLASLQRLNTSMEIAIALGTSGSFAALAFWKTQWGKVVFGGLTALSAFLSVIKPVLNLSKKIERVSKLWTGYNIASNNLRRVVADVRAYHDVRPEMMPILNAANDAWINLAPRMIPPQIRSY